MLRFVGALFFRASLSVFSAHAVCGTEVEGFANPEVVPRMTSRTGSKSVSFKEPATSKPSSPPSRKDWQGIPGSVMEFAEKLYGGTILAGVTGMVALCNLTRVKPVNYDLFFRECRKLFKYFEEGNHQGDVVSIMACLPSSEYVAFADECERVFISSPNLTELERDRVLVRVAVTYPNVVFARTSLEDSKKSRRDERARGEIARRKRSEREPRQEPRERPRASLIHSHAHAGDDYGIHKVFP